MVQSLALAAAIAALLSMGINAAVVKTWARTRHLVQRDDLSAVQASHNRPTSRLGGLGVLTGFGGASLLLSYLTKDIIPILLIISVLPLFLAGLLEDMGQDQSPRRRLFAAVISAVFAITLTNTWIKETGLPGADLAISILPIAWGITVLWSAGVCNAFNLVDGVNGLAGFLGSSISVALGYIAWTAGDILMAQAAIVLAAAIAGFLIFNWPWGRIFLGDAGAYSIGHLLVWISILIAWRNPSISYTALCLMFFWPVADTFLAMWRRSRQKKKMMHPDYLHAHQFIMRAIQLRWNMTLALVNSLTTLVLAPFFLPPVLTGVILADRPNFSFLAWIVYGVVFFASYLIGIRWVRRQGWRKTRPIR